MQLTLVEVEYIKNFFEKTEIIFKNKTGEAITGQAEYGFGKNNKKKFIVNVIFTKIEDLLLCEIFHYFEDGTKITTKKFDPKNDVERFNNKFMNVALKAQAFYILE